MGQHGSIRCLSVWRHCPQEVTMRNKDTIVKATTCDFYISQELIKSPGQVTMKVGNNTLIGRGLTYDMKSEDFSMLGGVQAIFNPETVRDSLTR